MPNHYSFNLLLIFTFFLTACNDEELEAPVPAFITIEDIEVVATDASQGSTSDNIKDAWVYEGNQLLGIFELPATIPIQNTGNIKLQIGGGIFNNALSNDRDLYPFYNLYQLDTFLAPQQAFTLVPKVAYTQNADYDRAFSIADFEGDAGQFERHPNSDTIFVRETQSNVFEGSGSGLAYLDENMDFFEARSPTFDDIPRDGRAVYLEMDYFCSHNIAVSIYTNNQQRQFSIINFRPSGGWTKAYVELGPVFSTLFASFNYNIAIGFTKPLGEVGFLYVDNVKLISFP